MHAHAGPDKFSEIFLGEFDTPEAIWSSEMRQTMIQKIAAHIADFSPRLLSNTRSTYQVKIFLYLFDLPQEWLVPSGEYTRCHFFYLPVDVHIILLLSCIYCFISHIVFPTQYCAMPVIQYPQLENELFCNVFYLRHLCDTQKFPDWPIKEPVSLLNRAYLQV